MTPGEVLEGWYPVRDLSMVPGEGSEGSQYGTR